MLIVYGIALTVVNAFWMLLNVLGLPGNWLIVGTTALTAYLLREQGVFHIGTLIAMIILATAGEILEFMLGAAGAAKSGSSRRGAVGAILGAIAGGLIGTILIPLPIIGSIIGACAGAFIGALAMELRGGKPWEDAMRIGHGAAVGRFWGTLAKLSIGIVIWATAAVAVFVP